MISVIGCVVYGQPVVSVPLGDTTARNGTLCGSVCSESSSFAAAPQFGSSGSFSGLQCLCDSLPVPQFASNSCLFCATPSSLVASPSSLAAPSSSLVTPSFPCGGLDASLGRIAWSLYSSPSSHSPSPSSSQGLIVVTWVAVFTLIGSAALVYRHFWNPTPFDVYAAEDDNDEYLLHLTPRPKHSRSSPKRKHKSSHSHTPRDFQYFEMTTPTSVTPASASAGGNLTQDALRRKVANHFASHVDPFLDSPTTTNLSLIPTTTGPPSGARLSRGIKNESSKGEPIAR
ncbi:hypothetical protein HDU98_002150 [Podochytrium sp. JEL0797]|nr:hypothetical protein HDU98_002150 [Podochytrium sp. JEL0797]